MRIPLSWLGEFVALPEGTTPDDVHAALVRVGLEEEGIHGDTIAGPVVVGEVLEFVEEPQANGKTIRWCQVRVAPDGELAADGGEAIHGIVCGASNFFVGDKVVVSLPGSVLPGPFPITARKTYGHVSDGMMASARELGLGDEHDGILRLDTLGIEAAVGSDALAVLGLGDSAVEINVTPDRGYALSIRGVAREFSHATGAVFRDPVAAVIAVQANTGTPFPVVLDDKSPIRGRPGVSVFATQIVRNVDASRPTPSWMVSRLNLAGVRSRSLLVDITNYVMIEFGQPIHGYDLDTLRGGIRVRRAVAGEAFTALDDKVRVLESEDLVIADDRGIVGLAGVMGAAQTELSATTTNVLVEAANFDSISIARTARRHKLSSEASRRFERGVDPLIAEVAASRVVELIVSLAGGDAEKGSVVCAAQFVPRVISLPESFVAERVGVDYSEDEIFSALTTIGATVVRTTAGFDVSPPSWRPDLIGADELSEEVARLGGYDRIPSILPTAPAGRGYSRPQRLRRQVVDALASSGVVEVLSFPFVSDEANKVFGAGLVESSDSSPASYVSDVASVRLANAIDQTSGFLRRSLIPGLIGAAQRNRARGLVDLALFERGLVFLPEQGLEYGVKVMPGAEAKPSAEMIETLDSAIPPQPWHIAALLVGQLVVKQPGLKATSVGIVDALDVVRRIAGAIGSDVEFIQGDHPALHPGRTAFVLVAGRVVGFAGELHPAIAAEHDLPDAAAVVELDLDLLIELTSGKITAHLIGTFPAATQDVSLIVDISVPAASVAAALTAGCGSLLESAELVDDYRGDGVEAGLKSLTFALRFRAPDRTLTAAEASESKSSGVALAAERFNAVVRA